MIRDFADFLAALNNAGVFVHAPHDRYALTASTLAVSQHRLVTSPPRFTRLDKDREGRR